MSGFWDEASDSPASGTSPLDGGTPAGDGARMDDQPRFELTWRGYHPRQVRAYLEQLTAQLAEARTAAHRYAEVESQLSDARCELAHLRGQLRDRPAVYRTTARIAQMVRLAEQEAAEILHQARQERQAAIEEARRIREEVFAQALAARRDFELALQARRKRQERLDALERSVAERQVSEAT